MTARLPGRARALERRPNRIFLTNFRENFEKNFKNFSKIFAIACLFYSLYRGGAQFVPPLWRSSGALLQRALVSSLQSVHAGVEESLFCICILQSVVRRSSCKCAAESNNLRGWHKLLNPANHSTWCFGKFMPFTFYLIWG